MPELRRSEAGRAYVSQHYEDIGEMLSGPARRPDRHWRRAARGGAFRRTLLAHHDENRRLGGGPHHFDRVVVSCGARCRSAFGRNSVAGLFARSFRAYSSARRSRTTRSCPAHPSRWCVPHSRFNDLREDDLVANDFCVLSRSPEAGADLFVRQRQSLSIYLQGHPEYDAAALFREYRRDIRAFVARETRSIPCDAARLFRRSHRGRIDRISRARDARSRYSRRAEFSRRGIEVGA